MAADRRARRRSPLGLVALACVAVAAVPASSAAVSAAPSAPRPSLPVIERQVMCVTCKIPLNVAESVQADRERAFIQGLIDEGRSEAQIKRALVSQYGPAVLGLPATSGFDLTAYLVPIVVVLTLVALLLVLLPRWRRRARAQAAALASPASLPAEDAKRLDADLARFD